MRPSSVGAKAALAGGVLALFLLGHATNAAAIPVDLSTFSFIDPTVTLFGPGNSSAVIGEDPSFSPVTLLEYGLPIPADAATLTFDYELQVLGSNEDYFDFYFGSLASPVSSFGGYEGIFTGTLSWDLTGFAGADLPIAFALSAGFGDSALDSTLTVSNVSINPIPEPSAFLLLAAGLLVVALRRT